VEDEFIEFNCGGSGFGPSTSYYGFYYSANGKPLDIFGVDGIMTDIEKGLIWEEEDGEDNYYTEKIISNIYYYEANF